MDTNPTENLSHSDEKVKSINCPSCRKKISIISKYCPICGNELRIP